MICRLRLVVLDRAFWSALTLFALGACQSSFGHAPITENDYQVMQAALRESHSLRNEAVSECVAEYDLDPASEELKLFSGLLRVPPEGVPDIICRALMNAIAIGVLDYRDFVSIEQGDIDEDLAIRIIEIILSLEQESI